MLNAFEIKRSECPQINLSSLKIWKICLSSFFVSFEMNLGKEILDFFCLLRNYVNFLYFSFSFLSIQTAAGFLLLNFSLYLQQRILLLLLSLTLEFLLFTLFFKNPGQLARIYPGFRKHGNVKCQASISFLKTFWP